MAPDPAELAAMMPFAGQLGITFDAAGAQQVTGRMSWSAERCTASGVLHGGALMTLADSTAAACAYLNVPAGATTSTISFTATWFGAVTEGVVVASARPTHVGGRIVVVQTELSLHAQAGQRPIASTVQVNSVNRAP